MSPAAFGSAFSSISENTVASSMSNALNATSKADALDEKQASRLPAELYQIMISYMDNRDLKTARLVCHHWDECTKPYLFRATVFSPVGESIVQLSRLAQSPLRRHVTCLYLDTTAFKKSTTKKSYADLSSYWFARLLDRQRLISGPLCPHSLLCVLRSGSATPSDPKYLQGSARAAFVTGYTQYQSRAEMQQLYIDCDALYAFLVHFIHRFPNLRHVETISEWGLIPDVQGHFRIWLQQNIPRESLDLMGLAEGPDKPAPSPPVSSLFESLGSASQTLHPLACGPGLAVRRSNFTIAPLLSAAFRALRDRKVKLVSFKLPGHHTIGDHRMPWQQLGIVPRPSLSHFFGGVHDKPAYLQTETLLIGVFKNLKVLELLIDRCPFGCRSVWDKDFDFCSVPRMLNSMKYIESLAIGMRVCKCRAGQIKTSDSLGVGSVFFPKQEPVHEGGDGTDDLSPATPGEHSNTAFKTGQAPLNPWPSLQSLTLWDMPARQPDLIKLMRTVKDSLKRLTLARVYYRKPICEPLTTIPKKDNSVPDASPPKSSLSYTETPAAPLPLLLADDEDQWDATAEALSEILYLDDCRVRLSLEDREQIRAKLCSQIVGFDDVKFIADAFVQRFILHGRGTDFEVAAAKVIKADKKWREAQSEDGIEA